MHFHLIVLFALLASTCSAGIFSLFKPKPIENLPTRPDINVPAPKPKPKIDTEPVKPSKEQEQAEVNNLAGLKRKVDALDELVDYLDVGKDIVEAILGTQSTTAKGEPGHPPSIILVLTTNTSGFNNPYPLDGYCVMSKLRLTSLLLCISNPFLLHCGLQRASRMCVLSTEHQYHRVPGHTHV